MGHTILLADDSITIQKVIELTFSDEDFKLHTVGNGQKAIEEIRAVKPDIVLCDIIMPEKNGYEVCEFIKSNDDLRHIPVLLLTGAFEPFDQERARKAGCDGFLAKPFEPQTLISKVKDLLASAPRPAPAKPAAPPSAPARPAAQPSPVPPVPRVPPAPSVAKPSPPRVAEVRPAPPPPRPAPPPPTPAPVDTRTLLEPEEEGEVFIDEGFAIEAGDRELTVEPGDQTVLLGEEETPSTVGEDIWSEVQQAEAPPQPADEGATVYMAPEPGFDGASSDLGGSLPAGFDVLEDAEGPGGPTGSATWALPSTDEEMEPQPAESDLTPIGDFSGFDDFSAPEQLTVEEPSPPVAPPKPVPGPSRPRGDRARSFDLPPTAEPETVEKPRARVSQTSPPAVRPPWAEAPEEPGTFAEQGGFTMEKPIVEKSPAVGSRPPARAPGKPGREPVFESPPAAAASSPPFDMDALVEKVAERVIARLSDKVIQDVAWEVVPDLAQVLIQKEIDALKAKIPD